MQIQVNTDRKVIGGERLVDWASSVVQGTLGHLSDHITRAEVHMSVESGSREDPHEFRCLIEARLEGYEPVAASHHDRLLEPAVDGAALKLARLIEHSLQRSSRYVSTRPAELEN